jgi:hypothetical protein
VFTLGAIVWQSWETRRSANAAIAQMRTTINRDKAVIKVQPQAIAIMDNIPRDYWFLHSKIGIRNVGMSRAYILAGKTSLSLRFAREKPKLKDISGDNLRIVERFIQANTDPDDALVEEMLYAVHNLSVAEQAEMIFPGKVIPYIWGFVEYETIGTVFRRNFHYSWRSRGRNGDTDFQMYRMLHSFYPNTPASNQEKISAGEWFKESEGNEEYEVKPQSPPGLWEKIKDFLNPN